MESVIRYLVLVLFYGKDASSAGKTKTRLSASVVSNHIHSNALVLGS